MFFSNSPYLIYLITGGLTILFGLFLFLGWFAFNSNKKKNSFDQQFESLISDDSERYKTKETLTTRWNGYWAERFKGMGWTRYAHENSLAGRDALLLGVLIIILVTIFLRNPIFGVFAAVITLYLLGTLTKMRINREQEKINYQLPGFLFALKANVQASTTPERAILKVVDKMPSPLYDDLIIVKNRILANGTFKEAIEELKAKTASKDLKFLCACMIQASESGANLEDQITTIQQILEKKQKTNDEINKAVRGATPAMWVATVVIPASFVAQMLMDPTSKEFWFKKPIAWAVLAAVVFLYAIGMWLTKKLVDGIRNIQ